MPLNPPSYIGHDVWYSPDVYVNQVPVALWQPPQQRVVPETELAKMGAFIEIESLQFQESAAQASNQTQAAVQDAIRKGIISEKDLKDNPMPTSNGQESTWKGNDAKPINVDTQGVENAPISQSMFISDQFKTLREITESPYLLYPHWIEQGIYKKGQYGLTPGQLVANAKLLAVNVLDPVRNQFPNIGLTSTIRPPEKRSQHEAFQAADIQLKGGDWTNWNKHYDIANWIQNNCQFDQLLLEYAGKGVWVHVSYALPGKFPANSRYPLAKNDPQKVGVMNGSTGKFVKVGGLYRI